MGSHLPWALAQEAGTKTMLSSRECHGEAATGPAMQVLSKGASVGTTAPLQTRASEKAAVLKESRQEDEPNAEESAMEHLE